MSGSSSESGGQVSEASNLEDADEPIMPDQSVAGAPDADSGETQEGKAGPNARTGNDAPEKVRDSSDQAAEE